MIPQVVTRIGGGGDDALAEAARAEAASTAATIAAAVKADAARGVRRRARLWFGVLRCSCLGRWRDRPRRSARCERRRRYKHRRHHGGWPGGGGATIVAAARFRLPPRPPEQPHLL